MGMNYYLRKKEERVHLGKSSAGWTFTFRGDKNNGVVDFATWLNRANELFNDGYTLSDEGDGPYHFSDLLDKIEKKRTEPNNQAKQYGVDDRYDWVDKDGNSFTDREFS